uniref:ESF1 homolog n=1 Tax=Erigeron canadensis TaxID=72917 RepID=UPI001CB8E0B2|nr:ESF1 homolog [Erigeron canadensis]
MGSKNKKNKNKTPDTKTMTAVVAEKVTGKRVFGAGNKAITDERFSLSQLDPRFQEVPKHKNKVAIDSRFNRMFTDKNFSASSAKVDKRGKLKNDNNSSKNALKQYYRIDENEEVKPEKQVQESEDEEEEVEEEEETVKKVEEKLSDLESESESGEEEVVMDDWTSTDTDEDDGAYLEEETEGALQMEENVPEIDKETNRLAVVNLDWNQVQAVDLFVVLSSFLPKTGQILSVSVYPSEFGLKRMEEEAVRGPVGLFDDEDEKNKKDGNSETSDDDEIDNEKLRAYELSRLRYYFAVVVCDSIATADYLYKSCDGVEFERSSNKLDLRFIPDSMEFKHPARDVATEAPANYEGIDFQTRALQLSKIDLTWDENEPQRSKKLKRKINVDQESEYVKDELALKEFIASSESETDEDENGANGGNNKRQKTDAYRALLQSGDGSDDDEEDDGMDMEVTFNTGLEDLSKKLLEKKDTKSETVWDAYLRKRKEKKKNRKNRSKDSSDDESDGSDGEPVEDPGDSFAGEAVKKKTVACSKKSKKHDTELSVEEGEASRAELELLLADDDGGDANVKGYNLKRNKSKGKKGKQDDVDEKIPTVDYDDPRFSSLFNRPEYALDPTDPQFKRSAAYVRQVAHKQQKGDVGERDTPHNDSPVVAKAPEVGDKHQISMLLKSLKRKSKDFSLPSDGRKSRGNGI